MEVPGKITIENDDFASDDKLNIRVKDIKFIVSVINQIIDYLDYMKNK